MKKLLVFFMVLFGISLGAMAVEWPNNEQDNDDAFAGKRFLGDGFNYYVVSFANDKDVPYRNSSDYKSAWPEIYNVDNIGGIEIYGTADAKRADGKSEKNIDLSKRRIKWVLNNIIPESWRSYCHVEDGVQTGECQVFIGGDSNDLGKSNGARDANSDERSVRIYIIWRQAQCPTNFVEKLGAYEKELNNALGKYPNSKKKIQDALDGVKKAKEICKPNQKMMATDVENLLDEVYRMLLDVGDIVVSIQVMNTEIGIDVSYQENSIDLQYSKLDSLRRGLGLSVWRDEEGKFNTARLISDSVAGVVLGTVGGIVTSKLVKKNQLKKGFEDLYCAIGGQTVAEYGDDFTVGLR